MKEKRHRPRRHICKIQGYEERNRVGVQVLCAKSLKYGEALISGYC